MSRNPFECDAAVPERLAHIAPTKRDVLCSAAVQSMHQGVIPAQAVADLVAAHELGSVRDLMLLLLDTAQTFARPAISDFHVGAVGLVAERGDLILAGNVEFPGTHLGFTMHGEGSVFTRAMHLGVDVAVIAIGEAHPCAHCRQCLAEYASSDRLELIDPLGHTLSMAQLYPWPFDPAYLEERGAEPGRILWPKLQFTAPPTHPLADQLLDLGRRSHSPYSKCPGALILEMQDGTTVGGFAIESVAFNPTIAPAQSAMVELLGKGLKATAIRAAVLGTVHGGAVDYGLSTAELLSHLAPQAALTILDWQP